MKLLKKLVLAGITSPSTISHYYSSDSVSTDTILSRCLRNLKELINRLSSYVLLGKRSHLVKPTFNHFNQSNTDARLVPYENSCAIDWAPVIKTTTSIKSCGANNRMQLDEFNNHSLANRSVLCVGGRMKLYPAYNQLIENFGGHLMTFHGNSSDHLDNLSQLLTDADMVICPIDCVNHDAFLIVKCYCKYSGKPCVLLDRSEINTFSRGVNILAIMATK